MIRKFKEYIKLDTPNTTLLFRVRKEYTEVLYYGHRLPTQKIMTCLGKIYISVPWGVRIT